MNNNQMQKDILILKVSEINRYLKNLIQGDPRLRDVWISGELSNFKHHRSGHMYFTVKDAVSSLRCVFFRRENSLCSFKPEDGMEVILHGNIGVYEPDGVYQLYVAEMEPAGLGSLFIAFEKLKKRLAEEGLFREDHKKELPRIPKKIGVITSPTGAALQDILAILQKRLPTVGVVVVESLVQGAGAARDIVRAFDILQKTKDIDLIILARGGGSLEDLWPFNEEIVARAIYSSGIPVISAVGHETDFTISDFAADFRAPTPTAAATAAVPDRRELLESLDNLRDRALITLQRRLQQEKQLLDYTVGERFFRIPVERLRISREKLGQFIEKLPKEMIRLLQIKGMQLSNLLDKLESYSPFGVMDRGYSFCRDEKGKIIRSVHELEIGELIQLTFRDGRAECRTEKIEEEVLGEG
ncbi:MAG: exodeoxyribonuclease VII large subunit [Bacillota bacterium]|nr:exodeoxyribonuclease VII large subunit [Bacillota bacterium]